MILSTILVGKLWFAVMMVGIGMIAATVIWRREPKPEKVARFWRRYEESARLQKRRQQEQHQLDQHQQKRRQK